MRRDSSRLEVRAGQRRSTYIVQLIGELDLTGVGEAEMRLVQAEMSDAERILLDIEQLRFIDSVGLRVLLRAKRRAESNGGRLRITHGTGYVAEMFRLTALEHSLPFIDDGGGLLRA